MLSGENFPVVPSRELNIQYSKPTCYQLSHAAPLHAATSTANISYFFKQQPRPIYTCMRRHANPTNRRLASDSHSQCTLAWGGMHTQCIVHLQATATANVHLHEAACTVNISYTCKRQPRPMYTCMRRHAQPTYRTLASDYTWPMYTCMRRHTQPTYRPLASDCHGQFTLACGGMHSQRTLNLQGKATANVQILYMHLHEVTCIAIVSFTSKRLKVANAHLQSEIRFRLVIHRPTSLAWVFWEMWKVALCSCVTQCLPIFLRGPDVNQLAPEC